jgi:hypothetical protein
MTTIRRRTLFFALGLLAFSLNAFGQGPSIEVSTDNEAAEFSAQGVTRKVQVEVYAPSGELVFETNDSDGQSIRWGMVNQKGERVSDGVYLATITVVDAGGKKRKRIEQITVSGERRQPAAAAAGTVPSPDAPVTTTVNGTPGKLAKFTGTSTVGNSVVTEGAGGKVGVNVAPVATLQVNGLQPAPLASNGATAPVLLQTTGGKGGDTTGASGQSAGAGASISLVAGNGGSAPAGSTRGKGGNITLQPGSTGAGAGTAGLSGNVLMAPSGVGNVGIGTASPASKLTVNGGIQILGAANGIKFSDGSIQTKATTGTINGTGTANRLAKFTGPNSFGNSAITETAAGNVVIGTTDPEFAKLNVDGGAGRAIYGFSSSNNAVYGSSIDGNGVYASSSNAIGLYAKSPLGTGVYGESASGLAGRFEGRVYVNGNVVIGTTDPSSGKLHVEGGTDTGVYGNSSSGDGVYGRSSSKSGVYGASTDGAGVFGNSSGGDGVHGQSSSGVGVYGASTSNFAGKFDGNVQVNGTLVVGACTGCGISSDQNLKANFSSINPRSVLDRLASIPIKSWNYKADEPSVRHLGPMAQDFRAAFNLGADDKHIDMVDANGVTMASIQALYQVMLEKDRQNEQLAGEVRQLRAQMRAQQAQLDQVRRAVRRGRAGKR